MPSRFRSLKRSAPTWRNSSDHRRFARAVILVRVAGGGDSRLAAFDDRLRHGGRRPSTRTVSRTVLVKGLEYDHVIISDLERLTDHCNLYVALTRARKSVTMIGSAAYDYRQRDEAEP